MKKSIIDLIEMYGSTTDMFWSEGLALCLVEGVQGGSLRDGVLSALELWRENVLTALVENFGIELDWDVVSINETNPLIEELVEIASPG